MVKNQNIQPSEPNTSACAECGAGGLKTSFEDVSFRYGSGANLATLTVSVPVYHCPSCGFEFTDVKADGLMHDAVCNYVGVMTPSQIKQIREGLGLSKVEFAAKTNIGEASINRWERGTLIQNKAMDNFIYLLGLPGNFKALTERWN